jgi:tetratricopeptide (TPR) repeat protein
MSGGYLEAMRPRCARSVAAGLLSGLLISSSGNVLAAESGDAQSTASIAAASEDCSPRPNEKSIVVENGGFAGAEPDVAVATDETAPDALEPIANVSEYEPELAEGGESSTPSELLVPTPADAPDAKKPGIAPMATGTPAEPTSDDVCVEEEVADAGEVERAEPLEPASFSGVTPGVTTRAEVLSQWGDPLETEVGGKTLTYELENFPSIIIAFAGDRVESVRVQLFEPAKPQGLIAKLGLTDFRPAVIADQFGNAVRTIFPERGVTLNHRPAVGAAMASDDSASAKGKSREGVYEIVVRPIEAGPFILRAERSPSGEYTHRIADLTTALKLDSKSAHARWLLSQSKLTTGEAVAAERLAAEAVQMEPDNDEFRVQWAKCLMQLAQYNKAVEETRAVLEGTTASQIVRAQALEQMGLLAGLGSKEVQQRAVPLHNKAIQMADSLTTSKDPAVRTAANQVLLGAHLAIAERIALGDWQKKDEVVEQWISRGSALAEQMIAGGEENVSLRLQVAVSALAAGGRLSPPIKPQPWIAEAEQATSELERTVADAKARDIMNWQLGLAYFYAAEIQHRRGEADLAIKYGELADATLTPLAGERTSLPDTNYVLGRLYFQIGAVHAVHKQDHDVACQWYDRAADLLLQPVPVTPLANPGQHGDALVSMGVSYWEIGQRDRAYELTKSGVELVKQGVAEGLLAGETLNVPQGNLNAMARALGKVQLSTPEHNAGRAQMAQNKKSMGKRPAATRPQTRTADRRTTPNDGVRR